jgi:hypothetical protein
MQTAAAVALMLCLLIGTACAEDAHSAGSERATAYAASSKVVRFGHQTYITYLDVDFKARVAALDHRTGKWEGPAVIGQGVDNHAGGALVVTRDGILHLVYGPHGNPMRYLHTLSPGDIHSWGEPQELGVRTTYPSLVATPEGALYLAYRGHDDPRSTDWLEWQLAFHTRTPGGAWSRGAVMADLPSTTETRRANYHHRLRRDARGRLHLAWTNILVAPGRVYYLWSGDNGKTWSDRPGGAALKLPVNNDGPAPVYTSKDANLMLTMAPDAAGLPHLLYGPEYGSSTVEHVVPGKDGQWRKLSGFHMPGKTIWLHQSNFDRQGRLHATFFAEDSGRWISNTAVAYEAVWQPGRVWVCRPIADLTRYGRGCYMPALSETNEELGCLFYSGRDLDIATDQKGLHGHVGTDVYYANLSQNWLQRIAPRPGPRRKITTEWTALPEPSAAAGIAE